MMRLSIFLLVLFFGGCKAEYRDVSGDLKYSGLINNKYIVLEELLVHGIDLDDDRIRDIDIYKVSKKPGSAGRYVIKRFDLKKGSQIKINKVLRCENCFPARIVFSIDILSESLIPNKPIQLVDLMVKTMRGGLIMDPVFFEKF